jgi:hypothetical protein
MAPGLLRSAGLDPLNIDAEPQPPDGELGEIEQGVWASEGNSVVGIASGKPRSRNSRSMAMAAGSSRVD